MAERNRDNPVNNDGTNRGFMPRPIRVDTGVSTVQEAFIHSYEIVPRMHEIQRSVVILGRSITTHPSRTTGHSGFLERYLQLSAEHGQLVSDLACYIFLPQPSGVDPPAGVDLNPESILRRMRTLEGGLVELEARWASLAKLHRKEERERETGGPSPGDEDPSPAGV